MAKQTNQGLFISERGTIARGPVECLGMKFPNDEARRAFFTEKLREKLKDHEFRKIEGFPIGADEDILALSDPPYFTACPNPFIKEFIQQYGLSYNTEADKYHREPFAYDVSEGKNDPIYNAHSYHTKVPHRAIMRYILHYTRPGDIVFDGFCGTGMTAVAAQQCGVFDKVISNELPDAKWGTRYCVISDLSPEATFIAHSLNSPFAESEFSNALAELTNAVENQIGQLYRTSLEKNKKNKETAEIAYTIWTEVTICPECGHVFPFSTAAVSASWDEELSPFPCPKCKVPDGADTNKAHLQGMVIDCDSPIVDLLKLDRYYKDSLHIRKLSHVHHLYTDRTWYTLCMSNLSWPKLLSGSQMAKTRKIY
jgi:rubrerythrin